MGRRSKSRRHQRDAHNEPEARLDVPSGSWLAPAEAWYDRNRKHVQLGLAVLLLVIPLFLSVWFRSFSAELPITETWARSSVENSLRSQIDAQVTQQAPNLPAANRQALVDQQLSQFLAQNSDQIEQQVAQTAAYFKSQMQDDSGQTYLIAIDPHLYLRRVENNLAHGHPGDRVLEDGTYWNDHMYAPIGVPVDYDLHIRLGTLSHKIFSIFRPGISVMASFFWLPVILSFLAVFPAFYIGYQRGGLMAAFVASLFVAVHAGFLGRTAAGFSDTDAYVILLPLLAGFFFISAFEQKPWRWRQRLVNLSLMGFSFGLLALIWEWWFFFDLFLLVVLSYFVFMIVRYLLTHRHVRGFLSTSEFRWWLVMLGGMIVSTGIFVTLFTSLKNFVTSPVLSLFSRTVGIKAALALGTIWPNVFTTVAELNPASIPVIIGTAGGTFIFFLAIMGLIFSLVPRKELGMWDWLLLGAAALVYLYLLSSSGQRLSIIWFLVVLALPYFFGIAMQLVRRQDFDVKYSLLIIVWTGASIFTMTKGVRFILLLVPPLALGLSTTLQHVYSLLRNWFVDELKFSSLWVAPLLFVIISSIVTVPVYDQGNPVSFMAQGYETGLREAPSMNDAWWGALTKIKEESAPDAIVNSWWDFGHWFKYVADRSVTFDGASQTTPMAHWIGKVLLTGDEKEALAILRMLDCGSYLGVQDVKAGIPTHGDYEAITLTKEIIMLPKEQARTRLTEAGISDGQDEKVLNHTHCSPPENYFITSGDMIGKAGVWGHFGSWDFAKADAYAVFRRVPEAQAVQNMTAKYGWTVEQAAAIHAEMNALQTQEEVNTWISPWPGYPSGNWYGCSPAGNESLVSCTFNVGVGQQQGSTVVLERLDLNLSAINNSRLSLGFYDQLSRRVGANEDVRPAMIIVARNNTFETYETGSNEYGNAFLIDFRDDTSPRAIFLDPANAASMFTRLYYLDGYATTAFQKFDDRTSFTGLRIVTWKVDWSQLETLGLEEPSSPVQ